MQCLRYLEDHFVMHCATTQRMWMADKPGKLRNCALLFWFKNTLQVTLRSWYIYMQYLADNETSLPILS